MKKLFLTLTVLLALTVTISSCQKDGDKDKDECTVCGTYSGKVDSKGAPLAIKLTSTIGIDTPSLANLPAEAKVSEGSSSDKLKLDVSLSVEVSGSEVTVPVSMETNYDKSTNKITASNENITVTVVGIDLKIKVISLNGTFSDNKVDVDMVLDDQDGSTVDNIKGTIHFAGDKK